MWMVRNGGDHHPLKLKFGVEMTVWTEGGGSAPSRNCCPLSPRPPGLARPPAASLFPVTYLDHAHDCFTFVLHTPTMMNMTALLHLWRRCI